MLQFKKESTLLLFLIVISIILHFYNLNWGSPFYFHPDERNIASSVSQLQFPNQMNPNFFAYGSLPIYIIYFTGLLINYLTQALNPNPYTLNPNFDQAILISRFYSALFATLLIPILFVITRKHLATRQSSKDAAGILSAFLATTSVGFIQFSHFGTFEMWLTFFSVLLFWICLQKVNYKIILLMGIIFGILTATKISSVVLLLIILLVIPAPVPSESEGKTGIQSFRNKFGMTLLKTCLKTSAIISIALFVYVVTNPFVFLDYPSFKNSMDYESSLAIGTLPVFYTGEFFNTAPIIFQFLHIYPFLINPLITFFFISAFIYLCWKSIKAKNQSYIILNTFYIILFLSQAFLFAKWTRYMVPTLPFIYLITAIGLSDFLQLFKKLFSIKPARNASISVAGGYFVLCVVIFICCLFSFSYFLTAFVKQDTRIEAKEFAVKNIPSNAQILSEVYDLGIIPFNNNYSNITLFNFYDLDNNSPESNYENLEIKLFTSEYVILPSQRILKTRLLNKNLFPEGNIFYANLLNGNLKYQKIYETPCDVFCKITYLGDPIFSFEQTVNVFDRPTLFIFKKDK